MILIILAIYQCLAYFQLFDIIIIKKQSKHLHTLDLQFGFLKYFPVVQCCFVVVVVVEVIYECLNI